MTIDAERRARYLGFVAIGGLFTLGGLVGLWRAGQFGATRWRVIIACASAAIGLVCLVAALLQRRRG